MRRLYSLLCLLLLSYCCFAQNNNEEYWNNPKYILLDADSAEKQMKIDQENKRLADSTKAAEKFLADSVKAVRKERWKNRERKNVIRHEMLGRIGALGLIYERRLSKNRFISTFISGEIGSAFNNSSYIFDSYNISISAIFPNKFRLSMVVGIGCTLWSTDNPSPPTRAEREIYREQGDGYGYGYGRPFILPFRFLPSLITGFQINLSKNWNMQFLYTPLIGSTIDETLIQAPLSRIFQDRIDFGGINIGYRF